MSIELRQAKKVMQAAEAKANEIGVPMNIAILDNGANLKSFIRMDRALLGSIDIAIKKAKTSSLFNINSGDVGILSQPGGPLYNIEHSNGGVITFAGGIVLRNDHSELIGAIGVSGGSVEQDTVVALAGASALRE